MIKLKHIVDDIINESIFDDAFLKWTNEAKQEDIERYIDLFKILKNRNVLKGQESDISPWIRKPFKDFKQFVDNKEKEFQQIVAMKSSGKDIDRIFENDKVIIISPNTWESSCKYGANTKWCISGHVKTHWNDYTAQGVKFYFILPKNGQEKYAVAVYPNGSIVDIYNELDRSINKKLFKELLKKYNIPSQSFFKNDVDWNKWLLKHNYKIRSDGKIDIIGDVNLTELNLKKLPFNFGNVTGHFYCHYNQLTSLEGCPQTIGGDFFCYNNQLTSLKGCPQSIGGCFFCHNNQLTSLEGCPQSIKCSFFCYNNQLTSLEGCPQSVGGTFYCNNNQLTSLEGCPQSVGGSFYCNNNQLTSLEGCPQSVGGSFYCYKNQLTSLEGCPQSVGGTFYCNNNKIEFSKEYVKSVCNVKKEYIV